MILPECKTLLGICYKNKKFIEYLINANTAAQEATGYHFDIPFIKDFEGKSPLHYALDEAQPDYIVASYFLEILASTSFDLHSMAICDVLHKAVEQNLETLPDYFDSRYLQTYNVEKLQTEVYNT
jgi:ankyrin repeat protein